MGHIHGTQAEAAVSENCGTTDPGRSVMGETWYGIVVTLGCC